MEKLRFPLSPSPTKCGPYSRHLRVRHPSARTVRVGGHALSKTSFGKIPDCLAFLPILVFANRSILVVTAASQMLANIPAFTRRHCCLVDRFSNFSYFRNLCTNMILLPSCSRFVNSFIRQRVNYLTRWHFWHTSGYFAHLFWSHVTHLGCQLLLKGNTGKRFSRQWPGSNMS